MHTPLAALGIWTPLPPLDRYIELWTDGGHAAANRIGRVAVFVLGGTDELQECAGE